MSYPELRSASIRFGIRCAPIRVFKNSAKKNQSEDRQLLRRTETAQCLQSSGCLRGGGVAAHSNRDPSLSDFRDSELGGPAGRALTNPWLSGRADFLVGLRDHPGRNQTRIGN